MANMCSNTVVFEADENQMQSLQNLFLKMAEQEIKESKGQIPPDIEDNGEYMFDIRWDEQVLYYETRWSPNIDTMRQVADKFHISFTYDYEERGNMVFGQAEYRSGNLTDTRLDGEDFDLFEYDEGTNNYNFRDEVYESEYEILELLLDEKKLKT
jgi:hypothetical protein